MFGSLLRGYKKLRIFYTALIILYTLRRDQNWSTASDSTQTPVLKSVCCDCEDVKNTAEDNCWHTPKGKFASRSLFDILEILLSWSICTQLSRRPHIKKFGMDTHIGKNSNSSKTEWIFSQPPGFFNQELPHNGHETPALHVDIQAPLSSLLEAENVRVIQETNQKKNRIKKKVCVLSGQEHTIHCFGLR